MQLSSRTSGPLFLPIETLVRELDAKILLASAGLARGYSVVLGRKGKVARLAARIGRGIYLNKDHNETAGKRLFPDLVEHNIRCTALDEEGLVFVPDRYTKTLGSGAAFDYLRPVFTWGEEQTKILLDHFGSARLETEIVGNPRFDLLREPFTDLFKARSDRLRSRFGTFLLVNTNFAFGNFSRFYGMDIVEYARKVGLSRTPEDDLYVKRRASYYAELYTYYVELLKRVATENEEIVFVVRPHPSEELSTWRDDLGAHPNVKIISEGNVVDWIAASSAVVHTGCTTGIEAFMLKKPVLRYHPVYDEEFEIPLPNSFGESFAEPVPLTRRIRDICARRSGQERDQEQLSLLNRYVANGSGRFSYERILDVYDGMEYGAGDKENLFSLELEESVTDHLARSRTKLARFLADGKIADAIGSDRIKAAAASTEKFPGLKKKELERRIRCLREIRPAFQGKSVAVREVDRDTFLLAPS